MTAGSKNRLLGLAKGLGADWAEVKNHWNDGKSQEFEKRYIEELMTAVSAAMTNIDAVEKILNKVREDCE
jgi:hypothetical protein